MTFPRLIMRHTAPALLRYVLVSFGVSVLLTRLYLGLTGFPKISFGGLQFSHLLWGGLALIAAALLMLIYASPGMRKVSAVLTGVGIGLFIDEVGKFITADNNYFYQPAAPIIYLCFLLVALIYERVALSQRVLTEREALGEALDDIESLIERNPYAMQRIAMSATLLPGSQQLRSEPIMQLNWAVIVTTILKAISGQDCLITVLLAIIAPVDVIGWRAGLTFRIGSELILERKLDGVARKDKGLTCFHNSIVVILLGGASLAFLLGLPVLVEVLHTDSGGGLHLRNQQRAVPAARRKFAPACLDWTERVPHMGGWLGAEITAIFFANKWLRRMPTSRVVRLTHAGEASINRMAVLYG